MKDSLNYTLDFTLDDFSDSDNDLYISKKKVSSKTLNLDDKAFETNYLTRLFKELVEKIFATHDATLDDKEKFKDFIDKGIKYTIHFAEASEIQSFIGAFIHIMGVNVGGNTKKINLNWIDTSKIDCLANIFSYETIICDINEWNVSNVKDMNSLFYGANVQCDISSWDVSNVKDMSLMFEGSTFRGDISKWNVNNVKNMNGMFKHSLFNNDISLWNVNKVKDMSYMFANSKFNQDISKWNISDDCKVANMFYNCSIDEKNLPK